MTQCTPSRMTFAKAGRREVGADFGGGRISSDAGLLLLRETAQRGDLLGKLAACLDDDRQSGKIAHSVKEMLTQRVFAIAAGYEDGNDHADLRHDTLLQTCAARPGKQLASPATLSRFENGVNRRSLMRMQVALLDHFLDTHSAPPGEIVLDFDASDIEVHGKQEKRFFHGYYDHYCFLPLYIYCGDYPLLCWLRPADRDAAKGSLIALKLMVKRIRSRWPTTRIVVRGDSGFCRDWLLGWCEGNDVGYIVGLAKNERLESLSKDLLERARADYETSTTKARVFGEFDYATLDSWRCERRVIARIEHDAQGANPRYIVTNLAGDKETLYKDVYCARGEMENRIKEHQHQLFGSRTSCHEFLANQFRLMEAAAAYVLITDFKRLGLTGTEMAQAEAATIRVRLLKIGAQVIVSARRLWFRLSSSSPAREIFMRIHANLLALDST